MLISEMVCRYAAYENLNNNFVFLDKFSGVTFATVNSMPLAQQDCIATSLPHEGNV